MTKDEINSLQKHISKAVQVSLNGTVGVELARLRMDVYREIFLMRSENVKLCKNITEKVKDTHNRLDKKIDSLALIVIDALDTYHADHERRLVELESQTT